MKKDRDTLSQAFDTWKKSEEIDPVAADNIVIAWPVILDIIWEGYETLNWIEVLDFGCWTGWFCSKLQLLWANVTWIDYSKWMIEIAKKNCDEIITLLVWDASTAEELSKQNGKYDLIASIMAFQFIENIEETIKFLDQSMKHWSTIIFAVWNPEWIKEWIRNNNWSELIESNSELVTAKIPFDDATSVLSYNRYTSYYDGIFNQLGYEKIINTKPPFTKEFIDQYKPNYHTNVPEFSIFAYKKI